MRRIRTAEPAGSTVRVAGRTASLPEAAVERAVRAVLEGERRRAEVSVTFLGPERMRRLHAAWKGEDRPTDVLAFALVVPSAPLQGDIYVCRAIAAREAKARGLPLEQELLRLVIHGTLHVLGYDHPDDAGRIRSPMWRKQERYLACLG